MRKQKACFAWNAVMYVHGGAYNEIIDCYNKPIFATSYEEAVRIAGATKRHKTDTIAFVAVRRKPNGLPLMVCGV